MYTPKSVPMMNSGVIAVIVALLYSSPLQQQKTMSSSKSVIEDHSTV